MHNKNLIKDNAVAQATNKMYAIVNTCACVFIPFVLNCFSFSNARAKIEKERQRKKKKKVIEKRESGLMKQYT